MIYSVMQSLNTMVMDAGGEDVVYLHTYWAQTTITRLSKFPGILHSILLAVVVRIMTLTFFYDCSTLRYEVPIYHKKLCWAVKALEKSFRIATPTLILVRQSL